MTIQRMGISKENIVNRLDSSVIRVKSSDSKNKFGSAFLVHREGNITYWITCAHVINELGGINKIKVEDEYRTRKIELIGISENDLLSVGNNYDLAVFKVEGFSSKETLKIRKTNIESIDFISLGNLRRSNQDLKGPIRGKAYQYHIDDNGAWRYHLRMDENSPLNQGYSGSPIYIPKIDKVVGVISQKHKDNSNQGYGISIEAVTDIFRREPELNGLYKMLSKKVYSSSVIAVTSLIESALDLPLKLFVTRQTRMALKWFLEKRITKLTKEATDYAIEYSDEFKNELSDISNEEIKLELIGDFQWTLEKYIERIYSSLLNQRDTLLVHNNIRPVISPKVYKIAFDYIEKILPDYLEENTKRKISRNIDCLITNLGRT